MRAFKRSQRVSDQIKRDAAEVISEMLRDKPDMMVTVSDVAVTDDLRYAKIYYTVLGGDELLTAAQEHLKKATGYIQSELARRLQIRRIPEISLHYDTSLIEGMRMSQLIDDVMSEDKNKKKNDEPEQD